MTHSFAIGWPSWSACFQCYRVSEYLRHDHLTDKKPQSVVNCDNTSTKKLSTLCFGSWRQWNDHWSLFWKRKYMNSIIPLSEKFYRTETLCWKILLGLVILSIEFQQLIAGSAGNAPEIRLTMVLIHISFVDFKPEKHHIANTLYMDDLKLVTQMETNNCQAPQAICNYSVLQTCLFHISFGGRESIFQ